MGTWMATVTFPDGTRKYTDYSTVVMATSPRLYAQSCPDGGILPDGERCYRATVIGEPDPIFPLAPAPPLDRLVLVEVDVEPYHESWHALYCPVRGLLLGPHSSFDHRRVQEEFELIRAADGVRHLCRQVLGPSSGPAAPNSVCGLAVPGEPLEFRQALDWPGRTGPEPVAVPPVDLFAGWGRPDVCRPCLFGQLDDVVAGYARMATYASPTGRRRWYHRLLGSQRSG